MRGPTCSVLRVALCAGTMLHGGQRGRDVGSKALLGAGALVHAA